MNKSTIFGLVSGFIISIAILTFVPKISPQFFKTSKDLNTAKPLNKGSATNGAKRVKPSLEAQEAFNKGENYLKNTNFDEAIIESNRAIQLNPDFGEAFGLRGKARYWASKGNYDLDQAIADLTIAIQFNSNDPSLFLFRGQAYKDKGNFDLAIADYKKVLEFEPKNEMAYTNLGNVYIQMNDYKEAEVNYKKILEFNPHNKEAKDSVAFLETVQEFESFSSEFYNHVTFPLELSDTPVRAIYYDGTLSQENIEKFEANTPSWSRLRTDFISPTCVRYIYSSWLSSMDKYKGNDYCLYFVNKKLKLASLFRAGDDWESRHQYDIQMLIKVDPSLYQEAQLEKQRRFEIYKTIVANSDNNQDRNSPIDNYIESMHRERENAPTQKYMADMVDIEKKKLEIMRRNQQNNSYNVDCHSNGSNVNCTTSPSVIDLSR